MTPRSLLMLFNEYDGMKHVLAVLGSKMTPRSLLMLFNEYDGMKHVLAVLAEFNNSFFEKTKQDITYAFYI